MSNDSIARCALAVPTADKFIAQLLVKNQQKKSFMPTIDPEKTYNEEDIVQLLKKLPDVSRFPLPESWYDKYGFVKPEPMSIQEVFKSSFTTMFAPSDGPVEERPPAEGGVRILPEIPMNNVEDVKIAEVDQEPKLKEEVESIVQ
jgi:hypothetical protein